MLNGKQTFVDLTLEATPCLHVVLAKQPKESSVYLHSLHSLLTIN